MSRKSYEKKKMLVPDEVFILPNSNALPDELKQLPVVSLKMYREIEEELKECTKNMLNDFDLGWEDGIGCFVERLKVLDINKGRVLYGNHKLLMIKEEDFERVKKKIMEGK